ncbi:hypothetical protein TWF281_011178 [Arthrobotrys megalospora]
MMVQLSYYPRLSITKKTSYYLLLLPLFLIQGSLVFGQTGPSNNDTVSPKESIWFQNCDYTQQKLIKEAFEGAKLMLELIKEPDWGSYAAVEFLGTNYLSSWGPYEEKVTNMLKKAFEWADRQYWFSGPYVRCEAETQKFCNMPFDTDNVIMRYDASEPENWQAQLYIGLCPDWFLKPALSMLITQAKYCMDYGEEYSKRERPFDLRWYESRELWLVHAIFHVREVYYNLGTETPPSKEKIFNHLINQQPFHDYVKRDLRFPSDEAVLGPWAAKKLATNRVGRTWQSAAALGSPANYAFYALAEYVQSEIGEYPYLPDRFAYPPDTWIRQDQRLQMCQGFDPTDVIISRSSYKPSDTEWARAPRVFRPKTPEPTETSP